MERNDFIVPLTDGPFDVGSWRAALARGHGPVRARRIGIDMGTIMNPDAEYFEYTEAGLPVNMSVSELKAVLLGSEVMTDSNNTGEAK